MSAPVVNPIIQSGVYRISSAARFHPELYLERQADTNVKGVRFDYATDAQKWSITTDEDGTYNISCLAGDITFISTSKERPKKLLWTIEPRGNTFIIGNPCDTQVLCLEQTGLVQISDRNNTRGQRWVLHLVLPINPPSQAPADRNLINGPLGHQVPAAMEGPLIQTASNLSSVEEKSLVVPADAVAAKDWVSMAQILAEQISRLVTTPPVPFGDLRLDSSGLEGFYYIRNLATGGFLCGRGFSTPPQEGPEVKVCSDPSVGTDKRDTFKFHVYYPGCTGPGAIKIVWYDGQGQYFLAMGPTGTSNHRACMMFPIRGRTDTYVFSTMKVEGTSTLGGFSDPLDVFCDLNHTSGQYLNVSMATYKAGDFTQMWRFIKVQ